MKDRMLSFFLLLDEDATFYRLHKAVYTLSFCSFVVAAVVIRSFILGIIFITAR